uniref:Putative ixodes 10 kDa peptide protein n=1 Tax=Ixodes ricinus TaxID=34613 RepID=A0A0K8RIF5_IXORI
MLPISKMQLVVFTLVLILPALQNGGVLFGYEFGASCMDILVESGEMKCLLEGYGDFINYDPFSCTLKCSESGSPKVPPGVCSGDVENCTARTREELRNWHYQLEHALSRVLSKKCPSFSKM